MVRVDLTLSNDGDESAIILLLDISHSVDNVFTDNVMIEADVSRKINFCKKWGQRGPFPINFSWLTTTFFMANTKFFHG